LRNDFYQIVGDTIEKIKNWDDKLSEKIFFFLILLKKLMDKKSFANLEMLLYEVKSSRKYAAAQPRDVTASGSRATTSLFASAESINQQ